MSMTYTWELPRDSTAPGQGRWHVRELLSDSIEAIDAELVVTELITNAWKHGSGNDRMTLQATLLDGSLRLEVCGQAAGDPLMRKDADAANGRGLLLIEDLADDWGFERSGDSVCVWALVSFP